MQLLLIPFLREICRTHFNIFFLIQDTNALLYRGPSGLLLLGWLCCYQLFRVHESVTNKEKKEKEVSSKTRSPPAFFPQQESHIPSSKWTM